MDKTMLSASHKANIANALSGRKQLEEHKRKRMESLKKTYEKRKKSVSPQS